MIAEATLFLKGVTLRARDSGRDMRHAIHLCEEELARQVKRHREKRRGRRKGPRRASARPSLRTSTAARKRPSNPGSDRRERPEGPPKRPGPLLR